MAKINLKDLIRDEIRKYLAEGTMGKAKLKVGDPGNLHGDERTQRQFVIDLAKQQPFGTISLSDIANALNTTRSELRKYGYIKRMYLDARRVQDDFVKVSEGVPFQSESIYQLIEWANKAPLSKEQLNKIRYEEEQKYLDTTGVFYSVYTWEEGNDSNVINIGYLNIRDDDDIKKYQKMLPKTQEVYGKIWHYEISSKKIARLPENLKDKIMTPEDLEEYIKNEFE